jgi:hypothetical protein
MTRGSACHRPNSSRTGGAINSERRAVSAHTTPPQKPIQKQLFVRFRAGPMLQNILPVVPQTVVATRVRFYFMSEPVESLMYYFYQVNVEKLYARRGLRLKQYELRSKSSSSHSFCNLFLYIHSGLFTGARSSALLPRVQWGNHYSRLEHKQWWWSVWSHSDAILCFPINSRSPTPCIFPRTVCMCN